MTAEVPMKIHLTTETQLRNAAMDTMLRPSNKGNIETGAHLRKECEGSKAKETKLNTVSWKQHN